LFTCNYELGLVFVEPPPAEASPKYHFKPLTCKGNSEKSKMKSDLNSEDPGLDKFVLPFKVPAPKYEANDQPATQRAIYHAVESWRSTQLLSESSSSENSDSEMASPEAEEEDESQLCLDSEAAMKLEEDYGEALWSKIEPSLHK
jgi:hypothetical protein